LHRIPALSGGVDALATAPQKHPGCALNEIGIGLVRQGGNLWAVEDSSAAGVAAIGSSQIEFTIGPACSARRGIQGEATLLPLAQTCAWTTALLERSAEIRHRWERLRS